MANERTGFTTNTTVSLPLQMLSYLKQLIFINFCVTFVKIRENQLPLNLKYANIFPENLFTIIDLK